MLSFIGHLQYYLPLSGILWHNFFLPNVFFQLSTTTVRFFFLSLTTSTVIFSHRDGYKISTVGILPEQKLANNFYCPNSLNTYNCTRSHYVCSVKSRIPSHCSIWSHGWHWWKSVRISSSLGSFLAVSWILSKQ